MKSDTEHFLIHYGKKGMHWGVRRATAKVYDSLQKQMNDSASLHDRSVAQRTKIADKLGGLSKKQPFNLQIRGAEALYRGGAKEAQRKADDNRKRAKEMGAVANNLRRKANVADKKRAARKETRIEKLEKRTGITKEQSHAAIKNHSDFKSGKISRKEYQKRDLKIVMDMAKSNDTHVAAQRAARKQERLKNAMNKPYNPQKKHMSAFKKAMIGVGTASAIAISTTLIRNLMNSPTGKQASNRGAEIIAMKIAEQRLKRGF